MKKETYLSGKAAVAGLMGWPVSHSQSPRLHGYWLRQHQLDGVYIPMPVKEGDLGKALKALPLLGFKGCNLTIPHKEEAMKYMDKIDPLAKRIGAINTVVVCENGKLEGRNTDSFGFNENLKDAGFCLPKEDSIATLLGAGGAARAIVVALQDEGFQKIRIVNRHVDRAKALARSVGGKTEFEFFSMEEKEKALERCDLLVNATSLGMTGRPALSLNLENLSQNAWVTDAVYAPLETDLLYQAKERGLRTVDGLGMLLHQAKAGFAAWFGKEPEVTQELRDFVLEKA